MTDEELTKRGRGRPRKAALEDLAALRDQTKPLDEQPLAVEEVADALGITIRRINQIVAEGWFQKPLTVGGMLRGLYQWGRRSARMGGRQETDVERERARKLRLENEERERHLVEIDDVFAVIDFIWGSVKGDMAGIGARVTTDPALSRRIDDEIDAKLAGIAQRIRKAGSDIRSGGGIVAADAEDETERVGAAQ